MGQKLTKRRTRSFGHPTKCPECGARAYHAGWGCGACGLGNPYHDFRVDLGEKVSLALLSSASKPGER